MDIKQGQTKTFSIPVVKNSGYAAATTFSATAPDGLTCTFNPTSMTGSGAQANLVFTVAASTTIPIGQKLITLSGSPVPLNTLDIALNVVLNDSAFYLKIFEMQDTFTDAYKRSLTYVMHAFGNFNPFDPAVTGGTTSFTNYWSHPGATPATAASGSYPHSHVVTYTTTGAHAVDLDLTFNSSGNHAHDTYNVVIEDPAKWTPRFVVNVAPVSPRSNSAADGTTWNFSGVLYDGVGTKNFLPAIKTTSAKVYTFTIFWDDTTPPTVITSNKPYLELNNAPIPHSYSSLGGHSTLITVEDGAGLQLAVQPSYTVAQLPTNSTQRSGVNNLKMVYAYDDTPSDPTLHKAKFSFYGYAAGSGYADMNEEMAASGGATYYNGLTLDYGDGSTGHATEHHYATNGVYTVSGSVTDLAGVVHNVGPIDVLVNDGALATSSSTTVYNNVTAMPIYLQALDGSKGDTATTRRYEYQVTFERDPGYASVTVAAGWGDGITQNLVLGRLGGTTTTYNLVTGHTFPSSGRYYYITSTYNYPSGKTSSTGQITAGGQQNFYI